MPALSDLTIQQMRSATKAQIITSIGNFLQANFTRRDLIRLLRDRDTTWDVPVYTYNPTGQPVSCLELERDDDTQAQIRKILTSWAYYPSGEIDTITIQNYSANNALTSQKVIKHYKDGKQPEVTLS
jgi:hypothetical protein